MSTSVESTRDWDSPLLIESSNYRLYLCSRLFAESPAWFCSHLLAMIHACTYHSANICKATTVTRTKRIDRNLLRKETSFVCYTSSVLRKSRHMKQKEKLRTVAKIKTQDYKNWRLQNLSTIATPQLHNCTTQLQLVVSLTVSISLLDSKWCGHLCTTVDYAEKHSILQPPKVHFY